MVVEELCSGEKVPVLGLLVEDSGAADEVLLVVVTGGAEGMEVERAGCVSDGAEILVLDVIPLMLFGPL